MDFAQPGDPLVDSRGDVLTEDTPESFEAALPALVTTAPEASSFTASERRVLSDLPAEAKLMHAVAAVMTYTILGISDSEIEFATGLTRSEIEQLKSSFAYSETFDMVLSELISTNAQFLQSRVAAYSNKALDQIAMTAFTSRKEELRFAGSKDLLDRADKHSGMSASKSDEFRVVITNKSDEVQTEVEISMRK